MSFYFYILKFLQKKLSKHDSLRFYYRRPTALQVENREHFVPALQ